MSTQVQYTGHGANTGGLQRHSIGDEYPYMIGGSMAHADAPTEWFVLDTRTGNRSDPCKTYREAEIKLYGLKLRNLMHS